MPTRPRSGPERRTSMPPPPPPSSAAVTAHDALPAGTPLRPGAHRAVLVPRPSFWRKLAAYSGPGYLVARGLRDAVARHALASSSSSALHLLTNTPPVRALLDDREIAETLW